MMHGCPGCPGGYAYRGMSGDVDDAVDEAISTVEAELERRRLTQEELLRLQKERLAGGGGLGTVLLLGALGFLGYKYLTR